jgi:hypothetical protein
MSVRAIASTVPSPSSRLPYADATEQDHRALQRAVAAGEVNAIESV